MDHYRFVDELDGEGDVHVACHRYIVIKETPKGYWIVPEYYKHWDVTRIYKREKHFVLKDSRVRFAYPDKIMAFASYRVRKEKQLEHLKRQMRRAKLAYEATMKIVTNEQAIADIGEFRWGLDERLLAGNIKEWWR